MTDILTKSQRSFNMSCVKSRDTEPEILLRKTLSRNGIRGYKLNYALPGKPDIVFTKKKIAIFIDGCFWHRCPCCFVKPRTRTKFWMKKINENVSRDKKVNRLLRKNGWAVLRFWEHQIRKSPDQIAGKIIRS